MPERVSPELGKCVALLGTGSDVGKSIVVTALCRIFADQGLRVAPFKAQNMSNNSFVTPDGGEIGRAQVVQAEACRLEPTVDMNPVLLKPCSDTGAQVILRGKPIGNALAHDYFADTSYLAGQARVSLDRLRAQYDLVVMEGAGSCAEVNLRLRDFVNFHMAHVSDAPVVLVADIDRGGVFAQLIGTLEVLSDKDRSRVRGFIINRFRGDASLFDDGIEYIEARTGLPVLGLVPYFYHIAVDSEDGLPLDTVVDPGTGPIEGKINVAVVRLPHISNFTDFSPLEREAGVNLQYLARPRALTGYDVVVLPGCKNVRADTEWFRETGWDEVLARHVAAGGATVGICGGYQMLGTAIDDAHGMEGDPGTTQGLGYLNVRTTLSREKKVTRSAGRWLSNGEAVTGYEIHMGETQRMGDLAPAVHLDPVGDSAEPGTDDGAVSEDGRVWGTYLHGLFDAAGFRRCFLRGLRGDIDFEGVAIGEESVPSFRDRQYDLLAAHFAQHLDMAKLRELVGV